MFHEKQCTEAVEHAQVRGGISEKIMCMTTNLSCRDSQLRMLKQFYLKSFHRRHSFFLGGKIYKKFLNRDIFTADSLKESSDPI